MADIKLELHTDEILDALDEQIEAALTAVGMQAETYVKQLAPVATGRLRNSITNEVDVSDKSVTIGSAVEYAPFVEQGTSKRRAKPYLRPAIIDHRADYESIMKNILSK